MKGVAILEENWDWGAILPTPRDGFDRYYWLFDSTNAWPATNLSKYEAVWAMHRSCLIDLAATDQTSSCVIDRGSFRRAFPWMGCDEWTSLVGFKCSQNRISEVVEAFDEPLSELAFSTLREVDGILIIHIDGWWEVFPETPDLLADIPKDLERARTDSSKWLHYGSDPYLDVYPDFKQNK